MAKASRATQTTPGCCSLGDNKARAFIPMLEVDCRLPTPSLVLAKSAAPVMGRSRALT